MCVWEVVVWWGKMEDIQFKFHPLSLWFLMSDDLNVQCFNGRLALYCFGEISYPSIDENYFLSEQFCCIITLSF